MPCTPQRNMKPKVPYGWGIHYWKEKMNLTEEEHFFFDVDYAFTTREWHVCFANPVSRIRTTAGRGYDTTAG